MCRGGASLRRPDREYVIASARPVPGVIAGQLSVASVSEVSTVTEEAIDLQTLSSIGPFCASVDNATLNPDILSCRSSIRLSPSPNQNTSVHHDEMDIEQAAQALLDVSDTPRPSPTWSCPADAKCIAVGDTLRLDVSSTDGWTSSRYKELGGQHGHHVGV